MFPKSKIYPNRKFIIGAVIFNLFFIGIYFLVPSFRSPNRWYEFVIYFYSFVTLGYCYSDIGKGKTFLLVSAQLLTIESFKLGQLNLEFFGRIGSGFIAISLALLFFRYIEVNQLEKKHLKEP